MAKSREDRLKEQLGALAFQMAILMADLDAAQETIAALKAESEKAKQPPSDAAQ